MKRVIDNNQLSKIIKFHENALAQYRFLMSSDVIWLEEMTIATLNEIMTERRANNYKIFYGEDTKK